MAEIVTISQIVGYRWKNEIDTYYPNSCLMTFYLKCFKR